MRNGAGEPGAELAEPPKNGSCDHQANKLCTTKVAPPTNSSQSRPLPPTTRPLLLTSFYRAPYLYAQHCGFAILPNQTPSGNMDHFVLKKAHSPHIALLLFGFAITLVSGGEKLAVKRVSVNDSCENKIEFFRSKQRRQLIHYLLKETFPSSFPLYYGIDFQNRSFHLISLCETTSPRYRLLRDYYHDVQLRRLYIRHSMQCILVVV